MDIQDLKRRFPEHWRNACAVRVLSIDAVQRANSGHPGMPMGMADVATVLFSKHLKFVSNHPNWPDRDRFILSAGHGSMLLYALLHLTGYKDFPINQLKNFRQIGSLTAGHPEFDNYNGIETTTGPLGQGLANSVGFAIAEELMRSRFGSDIVNHRTYVIVGDGCLMEGISQEAISLAGQLRLNRLIVLWDQNDVTIDGPLALSDSTDQLMRFRASGWNTYKCDGHNPDEIHSVLLNARASMLPTLIACRTCIGLGSPKTQGTSKAHGAPLGIEEIETVREIYGWNHEPFIIPEDIRFYWKDIGKTYCADRDRWLERVDGLPARQRHEYDRMLSGELHPNVRTEINKIKSKAVAEMPTMATRKASENVLKQVAPFTPEFIGGSADLTGSNNTKTPDMGIFDAENRHNRYIHYGIREHGMAAAMNGIALHGGLRPYGGTFLCFTDYARPSMRLSALMKLPVTYVMTHDSIGLGEDGPTHQPIEHLSMLRATPNMNVFRPCDLVETAECWELALSSMRTPSVITLTRQGLPTIRKKNTRKNLCANGAYIIENFSNGRNVILLATGSEVSIAIKARELLEFEGIGTRVVSMPCCELFAMQDDKYRRSVLPAGPVRIAIEAGVQNGWERWLYGEQGNHHKAGFVGMSGFGASAPAKDLFEHFAITAENVVEKVKSLL